MAITTARIRVKLLSPELQAIVLRFTMEDDRLIQKEYLSPEGDWIKLTEGESYRNHLLPDTWIPDDLQPPLLVIPALPAQITSYDRHVRNLVAWLQAFILHHQHPQTFALPDLSDATRAWEAANAFNVKTCETHEHNSDIQETTP